MEILNEPASDRGYAAAYGGSTFTLIELAPTSKHLIHSMSRSQKHHVVTSNLRTLLRERGLTGRDLAGMTGIGESAISRIANRQIIHRIDCDVAARICEALSLVPMLSTDQRVDVDLAALFPFVGP